MGVINFFQSLFVLICGVLNFIIYRSQQAKLSRDYKFNLNVNSESGGGSAFRKSFLGRILASSSEKSFIFFSDTLCEGI